FLVKNQPFVVTEPNNIKKHKYASISTNIVTKRKTYSKLNPILSLYKNNKNPCKIYAEIFMWKPVI
ncbi:MAG: hypothetical protein UC944_05365, partial [Anaerovibrio sp.]|nr:hypothetical protein [Anaerovibrio sp.]